MFLLLVAILSLATVLVYMFTSGITPAGVSAFHLRVESVNVVQNTVYVRNTGNLDCNVTKFIISNGSGETVTRGYVIGDAIVPVSSAKTITLNTDLSTLPAGNYTVMILLGENPKYGSGYFSSPFMVP